MFIRSVSVFWGLGSTHVDEVLLESARDSIGGLRAEAEGADRLNIQHRSQFAEGLESNEACGRRTDHGRLEARYSSLQALVHDGYGALPRERTSKQRVAVRSLARNAL